MANRPIKALLPAGLEDLLPPQAGQEEALVRRLSDHFAKYGYELVKPPLLEFEDGLLEGIGATVADETFRVMDPVSQRMMGLRADITPQVARLAATRLRAAPRPLRLTYSGEVLRVRGAQLRPQREFRAVGVELIGAAKAVMADAEVILLAAEAILDLGIENLSIDINVPSMARMICEELRIPATVIEDLLSALNRKNAATISKISSEAQPILAGLLEAAGPAQTGITIMGKLDLVGEAALLRQRLVEVVNLVLEKEPTLNVTIDPADSRGFEYHTGITFTLFARDVRGELGTGGRYLSGGDELATGFTLFTDVIMSAIAHPASARRIYVPFGVKTEIRKCLQDSGWITVNGLVHEENPSVEALRLECTHVWLVDQIQQLDLQPSN